MSTQRLVRSGTAPAPAPEQEEALPVDLLLEIVALADITTVVRFAATSRFLRRAILDPAFRRRLTLAVEADGFDPALLLGVSYREHAYSSVNVSTQRVIHTQAPIIRLRFCLQEDSFNTVASRDGLLVLGRRGHRHGERPYYDDKVVELQGCDTLTGNVTPIPPTTLPQACFHVVLSVVGVGGDDRRSFELLVADAEKRFYQTFSSKDSQWSAIRQVSVPYTNYNCQSSYCSAVIGRTVYWPCRVHASFHHWKHILALDVDSGETTMMELPARCFSGMMASKYDVYLLLASVRGNLCLLVSESQGIAMWTLTSSSTWSGRQVVISSVEIARQAGLALWHTLSPIIFEGFGERSGAVVLKLGSSRETFILRLDLGTKEKAAAVTRLTTSTGKQLARFFLHEIDLLSLLQAMKSF